MAPAGIWRWRSEGIESKRKRQILIPLEYSDNEDDENKTEERKKKIS